MLLVMKPATSVGRSVPSYHRIVVELAVDSMALEEEQCLFWVLFIPHHVWEHVERRHSSVVPVDVEDGCTSEGDCTPVDMLSTCNRPRFTRANVPS